MGSFGGVASYLVPTSFYYVAQKFNSRKFNLYQVTNIYIPPSKSMKLPQSLPFLHEVQLVLRRHVLGDLIICTICKKIANCHQIGPLCCSMQRGKSLSVKTGAYYQLLLWQPARRWRGARRNGCIRKLLRWMTFDSLSERTLFNCTQWVSGFTAFLREEKLFS